MNDPARISIALVTRDRPEHLRRCLQSWRAQSRAPFEIVISDDSDDAQMQQSNQRLADEYGCRYVAGPRAGLYANRNNAARACRGSHILTADDDHTHPRDYLESIYRLVVSDPSRVWIFSERVPSNPQAVLLCPAELRADGTFGEPADPESCAAIADGSTLLPAGIFSRGIRYDDPYRFGPLWYLLGRKIRLEGWRISFSRATHVWHHVAPSFGALDRSAQTECHLYVLAVNAFWLRGDLKGWLRMATALVRTSPIKAIRALRLALRWRHRAP